MHIFKTTIICLTSMGCLQAYAQNFNLVNKEKLIADFPYSYFEAKYTGKLTQALVRSYKNQDYLLRERTKACYKTVRYCENELSSLSIRMTNDKVPMAEQFNKISNLMTECEEESPKDFDTVCGAPIVSDVVKGWISGALEENPNAYGSLDESQIIYFEFRKEFYEYFMDQENTKNLNKIFDWAKSDLKNFLISLKPTHSLNKILNIIDQIELNTVFISFGNFPKHPFSETLTAGIGDNSIDFGPSIFFTQDLNHELAYLFLIHEMTHYFDMCTSQDAPYYQNLNTYDDYFITFYPLTLKNEYLTKNRISNTPKNDFQKWICNDQLVELVPDWIAARVFNTYYVEHGFSSQALLGSMTKFLGQPDPEGYAEASFHQHIADEERLRMTKRIVIDGFDY